MGGATPPPDPEAESEALRLKAMAESKFKASNNAKSALKYAKRAQRLCPNLVGISETVAALTVLAAPEPFASSSVIRRQYKKLALLLHPDKNPHVLSSEDAFKLLDEAFHLLTDRTRNRDSDADLHRRIEAEEIENQTFWTGCSTCRLLHQFERRYLGQELVCPSCEKSFRALEVIDSDGDGEGRVRSKRLKLKEMEKRKIGVKGKGGGEKGDELGNEEERGLREKMCSVGEVLERARPIKRVKNGEEMMTLAEFQNEVKRKLQEKKLKEKEKGDEAENSRNRAERCQGLRNNAGLEIGEVRALRKSVKPSTEEKRKGLRTEKHKGGSSGGELENMAVMDLDFYDFDKDRVEKSFKKGQVWAVYDDDDRMPRRYALIDETVSVNPFGVRISWLNVQNSGDGRIVSRDKMGFHIPCGRFMVARKAAVNSVNIFSHVVDSDRVAREVYKVYPKKGSVWALYGGGSIDVAEGKRCYDIVVFLTSYNEVNGVSMAYLEKVDGYKTVFKRQNKGSGAIRFLGKDDICLVSHQIPAQKLLCDETPELLKDCWELDPASLPSDLLTIGGIDN